MRSRQLSQAHAHIRQRRRFAVKHDKRLVCPRAATRHAAIIAAGEYVLLNGGCGWQMRGCDVPPRRVRREQSSGSSVTWQIFPCACASSWARSIKGRHRSCCGRFLTSATRLRIGAALVPPPHLPRLMPHSSGAQTCHHDQAYEGRLVTCAVGWGERVWRARLVTR